MGTIKNVTAVLICGDILFVYGACAVDVTHPVGHFSVLSVHKDTTLVVVGYLKIIIGKLKTGSFPLKRRVWNRNVMTEA